MNTSHCSGLLSSGPVDIDSLEYFDDENSSLATPANFSDILSTFEAESLADRMAPNTASTHHERSTMAERSRSTRYYRMEKTHSEDDSQSSNNSNKNSTSRYSHETKSSASRSVSRSTKLHMFDDDGNDHSNRSSRPSSSTARINRKPKTMYFDDDMKSLVSEVSILTMQTMEQSHNFNSPSSKHKRNNYSEGSIVTDDSCASPSMVSRSEDDVSFSGLFSTLEGESLAQRMDPKYTDSPHISSLVGRTIGSEYDYEEDEEAEVVSVSPSTYGFGDESVSRNSFADEFSRCSSESIRKEKKYTKGKGDEVTDSKSVESKRSISSNNEVNGDRET